MKLILTSVFSVLFLQLTLLVAQSKEPVATQGELRWLSITNPVLEINGLPWFKENAPEVWRFPKSAKDKIPSNVWGRALAPDGGRIRLATDTSRLSIRVERLGKENNRPCFIDAYFDHEFAGSAEVTGNDAVELTLFENKSKELRQVTIYLPNFHQVRILGIGLDADAKVKAPRPFVMKKPTVCYGSSVLQGSGAAHPSKTYPAILARTLDSDFVNLGFGGSGRAEPEVVDLVKQLDGSCFLFDLGKSYGDQEIKPYSQMLTAVRAAHPDVPIFCVTPIYATREERDPRYRDFSEKLRALMRQAATEQRQSGDQTTFVIEGLELFGPADKEFFRDPLHPNDEGNERLARRLAPLIRKVLLPSAPEHKAVGQ